MGGVSGSEPRVYLYTGFVVAVWAVAFPALVVWGELGEFAPQWRALPFQIAAAAVLIIGVALVMHPARLLASTGARLMSATPGTRLVTEGAYSRVRNPMDVGATVIACAPWLAIETQLIWLVPVAAFFHYTLGIGILEDRWLLETFGDEFMDYRRRVRKWIPR